MNFAHLHLLLNHLPVIGVAFALLVLAWGIYRKSEELIRTSMLLFVLVALITIPIFLTGDPARDFLLGLGVPRAAVRPHDNAAGVTLTIMEVLGGIALLGLIFFRNRERTPQWFLRVTLALALVAAASALWTANLGGQIRHPEASFGAPSGAPSLHAGAR